MHTTNTLFRSQPLHPHQCAFLMHLTIIITHIISTSPSPHHIPHPHIPHLITHTSPSPTYLTSSHVLHPHLITHTSPHLSNSPSSINARPHTFPPTHTPPSPQPNSVSVRQWGPQRNASAPPRVQPSAPSHQCI